MRGTHPVSEEASGVTSQRLTGGLPEPEMDGIQVTTNSNAISFINLAVTFLNPFALLGCKSSCAIEFCHSQTGKRHAGLSGKHSLAAESLC